MSSLCLIAVLGGVHAFALDSAAAAEPADLRARVERLELEIGAWRARSGINAGLDEARAAHVRQLVRDVLIDTDARSSSANQPPTAGWDSHPFLASAEGPSLMAAVIGLHPRADGAPDVNQYAAVVQAGVFLADEVEVFARYEWGNDDAALNDLHLLTVGFTRYIHGNDLKWTTDVGYALEAVSPFWASSSAPGWRADSPSQDGQVVVRSQLQWRF